MASQRLHWARSHRTCQPEDEEEAEFLHGAAAQAQAEGGAEELLHLEAEAHLPHVVEVQQVALVGVQDEAVEGLQVKVVVVGEAEPLAEQQLQRGTEADRTLLHDMRAPTMTRLRSSKYLRSHTGSQNWIAVA